MVLTFSTKSGLPRSGKNLWKMIFLPGQANIRELVNGQGNLERTWRVREKSNKNSFDLSLGTKLLCVYDNNLILKNVRIGVDILC